MDQPTSQIPGWLVKGRTDQTILKRQRWIGEIDWCMAWVDFKKAFDVDIYIAIW